MTIREELPALQSYDYSPAILPFAQTPNRTIAMKNAFSPSHVLTYFCCVIVFSFLTALPVSAESSLSQNNDTASADTEKSLMQQIKLFFNLGNTTNELNMEESGINGLNDTAGQSVGRNQLLLLKENYRKKIEKDPQNDGLWAGLGSILETLGEDDQALAAYEKAIQLNPDNRPASQGITRIRRSHRVLARVYYYFQHEKEYAPTIKSDLATWEEQAVTAQVSKFWGRGKSIGIGWLEGTIYQKNELYGDVDFSLKRQAPFFQLSWPLLDNLAMAFRVRDEKFTNNDDSGYYKVDGSQHIITGYLALSYRGNGFWADMNYSREREPDPIYDAASQRSALNIEVKQLTGISAGYGFANNWEIGSSLYYEQYGSARRDQWNPNIQLSHWFSSLPGARISLGYGYYTDEHENIVNMTSSYQWTPLEHLQLRVEYQLEYSGNEDSWLNQGDLVMNWAIVDRLSLVVRTDYSQEYGGDEDNNFYTQASLNWSFF